MWERAAYDVTWSPNKIVVVEEVAVLVVLALVLVLVQ